MEMTLQIKRGKYEELKECIILMQVDNLLIVKQPPRTFLDKEINIELVNVLGVRLKHGHLNERFQHLRKNLHIQFQG